jgi:chromosome segregation ATPase
MCKNCTQNPNAEEYGMTKEEQLQKDLELQAETIGYLRERIAELEEKLERKECGNKLLADKLEDVTKVKIELEQKLEQIKDEKFEKALSQIKHDREVVIEYNERLQKENTELKEQLKTSYRKGMRHMAKALKDYDRTDGAWTDYFEHTVDKVLQKELAASEVKK